MKNATDFIQEIDSKSLIDLFHESNTYGEILVKLNVVYNGRNIKLVKDRLIRLNIDVTEIDKRRSIALSKSRTSNGLKARPLNQILVNGIAIKSAELKKRLIKNNILVDVCSICGQLPRWNNLPLTLHLDHINGDNCDNRLENLRVICPNCHTQTDTYGSKNAKKKIRIKKIYYCIECGEARSLSSKSKLCIKCSRISKRKIKRPSKEELLILLKTKSYLEVGKMFGVSDNAIRKWLISED